METARDDDPSRGKLRSVVATWLAAVGHNRPKSTAELIKVSKGTGGFDFHDKADGEVEKAFYRALLAIAPERNGDGINSTKLGNWLSRNKDRVVDGSKIVREVDSHTLPIKSQDFRDDAVRPNLERPELREFRGDPVATVLADRGRYIAAVLTIGTGGSRAGASEQTA